jgi:hypothetical protein
LDERITNITIGDKQQNKIISQIKNNYEFDTLIPFNLPSSDNILDPLGSTLQDNTYGCVKLRETETMAQGVISKKKMMYATDASVTMKLDLVTSTFNEKRVSNLLQHGTDILFPLDCHGFGFIYTNYLGKSSQKEDYVIICASLSVWTHYLIQIVSDVDLLNIKSQGDLSKTLEKEFNNYPRMYDNSVIGVSFFDMDNRGIKNDLVFIIGRYDIGRMYVLHNVAIDSSGITYGLVTKTDFISPGIPPSEGIFPSPITACAITNIDTSSSKPDLILMQQLNVNVPNPNFNDQTNRKFYVMTNLTESSSETSTDTIHPDLHTCDSLYLLRGNGICLIDAEKDGVLNDLLVTGPGSFDGGDPRPLAYTLLKKINLIGETFKLQFTGGRQNFPDIFSSISSPKIGTSIPFAGVQYNLTSKAHYFAFFNPDGFGSEFPIVRYAPQTYTYDLDGQPNEIWETNSDGKKRIATPIPAYWKYPNMGDTADTNNKHMLTQPCQTIVYEKPIGDISTNLPDTQARSSQVTTWNALSSGVWRPCSTFAWQTPMNVNGAATTPLINFPFTNPTSRDTSWKFKGGITLYNSYGSPIEAIKPPTRVTGGAIYSSTAYGTTGNLSIGQISNANFNESGAFTCDYDFNDTLTGYFFNYFDKKNGWEKNTGLVVNGPTDKLHFGQKSLKIINGEGTMRNFKIREGTQYTLSAWVYIDSAKGANPGVPSFVRGLLRSQHGRYRILLYRHIRNYTSRIQLQPQTENGHWCR